MKNKIEEAIITLKLTSGLQDKLGQKMSNAGAPIEVMIALAAVSLALDVVVEDLEKAIA